MQLKGHVFRRHDGPREKSPAPPATALAAPLTGATTTPSPPTNPSAPAPATSDARRFFRTSAPGRTPANSAPPSRAASPSASPRAPPSGSPPPASDPQLLGHYQLRLSELLNKTFLPCATGSAHLYNATNVTSALAPRARAAGASAVPSLDVVSYHGIRLPDRRKTLELAEAVSEQLNNAAQIDSYLLRAVARQVLRALTLFANRVDSLMITPSRDPQTMVIPLTAKEARVLPPAMEFNVGLATTAWIVEDALERALAPPMPPFVADLLTPVRKQIEASILHVITPILAGERAALAEPILRAVPHPFAPSTEPPESLGWDKDLEQRLAAARLLLVSRIEARTSQDGEGWFISTAIHALWKALLVLSSRHQEPMYAAGLVAPTGATAVASYPPTEREKGDLKRAPSPAQLSSALKAVALPAKPRKEDKPHLPTRSVSGWSTPSRTTGPVLTPSHSEDWAVVPGSGAYRPLKATMVLSDLERFDHLFRGFVQGFLPDNLSLLDEESESDDDSLLPDEEDELARLALAEAVNALSSTITALQALQSSPESLAASLAPRSPRASPKFAPRGGDVAKAFRATPPLILLHILYARLPEWDDAPAIPPPHEVFGYTWDGYQAALGGFSANLTWARSLLGHWKPHVLAAARALDQAIAPLLPSVPQAAHATVQDEPLRRTFSAHSITSQGSVNSEEMEAMASSTPALNGPEAGEPKRRFHLLAPKKRNSIPLATPSLLRRAVSPAVRASRSSTPSGKETHTGRASSRPPSRPASRSGSRRASLTPPLPLPLGQTCPVPPGSGMSTTICSRAPSTRASPEPMRPDGADWALERLLTQRRALTRFAHDLEAIAAHVGLPFGLPIGPVPGA